MNSVWTDHYQRPLLTVCLYPRGAEGQSKLQQRPLITNLPLCVKFGTKLIGIRIRSTTPVDSSVNLKDLYILKMSNLTQTQMKNEFLSGVNQGINEVLFNNSPLLECLFNVMVKRNFNECLICTSKKGYILM